jgi:D-amino-acid dehydrogenase
MSDLMGSVYPDYDALLEPLALGAMLHREGALTLYDDSTAIEQDQAKWDIRGRHAVRFERVDGARIRELEPLVAPHFEYAVFVPEWSYVEDPYRFTRGLADACLRAGADLVQGKVVGVELAEEAARAVRLEDGRVMRCDQVVVAAGVWSQALARQLGSPVPLESERGYHVTLPNAGIGLRRFLLSANGGFVILPMGRGIRVAGTVELASLDAPPNYQRAWVLIDKARRILPDFNSEGATVWMGHRPALPDTVPVISRSPHYRNTYFAFGHGHLGLTLGATSGRLIADLIAGRDPGIDLQPFRVDRF